MSIAANIAALKAELGPGVTLVAVSKYTTEAAIREAYNTGHRDFGENKAQDLKKRQEALPADIRWHFIGHLQSNKVKYIAPFVHLIHSVDSYKLLEEIEKHAAKNARIIPCLLQMHIAAEETKFGLSENELMDILQHPGLPGLKHIQIAGLMGMASNTDNRQKITSEFTALKTIYVKLKDSTLPQNVKMEILSMGMSSDYHEAVRCGSTMVRIGSAVFTD